MSWGQWPAPTTPLGGTPNILSAPPPTVINPAPAVLPPGIQYTPEQWTQMQQQNWQQWAQWQQQYQQWHQQYGAEYQKSIMGAQTVQAEPPLPVVNTSAPPPLPVVEQKPPLPTEDPPSAVKNYSSLPPEKPPYNNNATDNWNRFDGNSNQNRGRDNWQPINRNRNQMSQPPPSLMSLNVGRPGFEQNKRPGFQPQVETEAKRPKPNETPPVSREKSWGAPAASKASSGNPDELSEAEKKFDKQFADWEAQFNKWKEQNAGHPDKAQYREYEKKWETWRAQLLERREQMKRKRLGTASTSPSLTKVPPVFADKRPDERPIVLNTAEFSRPPPTVNNEPLEFKNKPIINIIEDIRIEPPEKKEFDLSFLKAGNVGDIPGLDLVKDADDDETREEKENTPDYEALSKGINSILGDKNLLNVLSLVSQNQQSIAINAKLPEKASEKDEYSNPSYDDGSNFDQDFHSFKQQDSLNNFDDQTRSSFHQPDNQFESFGKSARNFDEDENQFGNFNDNFGHGDFNRGNFNTGGNFNRNQNFGKFNPGDNFNRGPGNFNDTGNFRPDNFNRGQSNFNRGPNNFNRGPDNFNRGPSDEFNRGPDFNKGPNDFNKGPNDFRGPNNFNRGPNDMNRGPNDMNRGPNDANRGPNNANWGPNNANRGPNNANRGPNNANRGSNDMNQGPNDFMRRPNDFNRPPNDFRGPPPGNFTNFGTKNAPPFTRNRDHVQMAGGDFQRDRFKEKEDLNFETPSDNWNRNDNFYDGDQNNESDFTQPTDVTVDYQEEELLKPATIIDYDHKSQKTTEMEILVEPVLAFDYRHKPVNRIPIPQRPKWLLTMLKPIREFEPNIRHFEPPTRRYDNRKFGGERRPAFERNYDRKFDDDKWNKAENESDSWNVERTTDGSKVKFVEKQPFDDDLELEEVDSPPENPVTVPKKSDSKVTLIEDLLSVPGRFNRPPRIVIILRGPPGSGKTSLAKLIKDKEVENGGSAPRILSLDDYFMVEQEKEAFEDGKKVKIKEMTYEYEECMEASYRTSLMKSFKKTITDGYFNFIIVDNVNDKVKYFGEMWSFAKQNGFQVYICQLELDVQTCSKRNVHGRTEAEIEKCVNGWEPTPNHHPVVDATSLIQSGSIPDVEMEEINSPPSAFDSDGNEEESFTSKWDTFDCSIDNLAKLDGTSKPLRPSRTMEDYLQMDDEWAPAAPAKPGQKRVRWADLEERKEQEKMRAIGFVVGQTNWERMMDPTQGGSALTQTKYIDRVGRY